MLRPGPAMRDGSPLSSQVREYCAVGYESVVKIATSPCYLYDGITFSFSNFIISSNAWWRHKMETFSALLAICAGNSPVTGEFPTQRPVTRSFDVFFDLRLNDDWVNNR